VEWIGYGALTVRRANGEMVAVYQGIRDGRYHALTGEVRKLDVAVEVYMEAFSACLMTSPELLLALSGTPIRIAAVP